MDYPEVKNARYDDGGGITCDLDHAQLGWIPHSIPAANTDHIAHIVASVDVADFVPVALIVLQEQAADQVKVRHAEMLVKLSGDYSSVERETWLLQLEWARGFIADQNTAHAVFLSGMLPSSPTGNMVDDARLMADKITEKSTAYAKLVMLSQRTKAQALAAIEAAQTPEQLATTMADMAAVETAAITELTQEEDK